MNEIEKIASDYVVRERSNYQLAHFVIGQHDTPQMQYRQILIEIKVLLTKLRYAELNVEKLRIKLSRRTDDPLDQIKAEKDRVSIAVTLDAMESAKRELEFLISLADKYPRYTPEEIEEDQQEYWEARLQRQANLDRLSVKQQVNVGNLQSMLQAGILNREITS